MNLCSCLQLGSARARLLHPLDLLDHGHHTDGKEAAACCQHPLPPIQCPGPNELAVHWACPSFFIGGDGGKGLGELLLGLGVHSLVRLLLILCLGEANALAF
jgi:hypothetical protein